MPKILSIVIVQLASWASILSLYISVYPISDSRPWWHWILMAISFIAPMYLIFFEIDNYRKSRPKIFKSQSEINKYLDKWISSGGKTAIFSRDMSWSKDDNIMRRLKQKAFDKELILCVQSHNKEISLLENCGAKVIYYDGLIVPRSRFTIVDFEKEGARVAVGIPDVDNHVIQEFKNGDHPFFGVAEDLVKVMMSIDKVRPT